jgi:ectoine hydroxylase-related dioxygenase (phytanoyl-CoA dioxygenase family)
MQKDNSLDKYNKDGYLMIENLFDYNLTSNLHGLIKTCLHEYANEINTSFGDYVSSTGRWGPKASLFRKNIFNIMNDKIKLYLEDLTGSKISLHKKNVICKNEYVTGSLALHQDISYSYNSPYNFTLWLSLDNIFPDSGEMIVIPRSHKWAIEKAVDFWSPYFKDEKLEKYPDQLKRIYLKPGDALLFDSTLWHGSVENLKKVSRYAYVTRWLIKDYKFTHIPEPQPLNFGMWNCHEQLKEILRKFYGLDIRDNISFKALLNKTKELMVQKGDSKAATAIDRLIILHMATELHDAGDLCGTVYRDILPDLFTYIQHTQS